MKDNKVSDKRILIDGYAWRPEDLLERLRSPELPGEEFWRSMSYALYTMKDDDEYIAALNEVKRERTKSSFPQQDATTPQNEIPDAPPRLMVSGSRGQKASAPKKKVERKINLKPKTLKYYIHGNNGVLMKQRQRVDFVYRMFNAWGWIDDQTSPNDFDYFFEGEPKHCNIIWTGNATILTILLQELIQQPYIEKQTGCAAKSLVEQQFGKTANSDRSRLDSESEERIKQTLFILNINNPIPERRKRYSDDDDDLEDATLEEVYAGGLRITKGI